jgi:DNA-binding MarR family transcriptional regulator
MNMTTPETMSDAGLASALRISVSRLARRLRAERAAHGLPVLSELSDTQMGALATLEHHGAMTPGGLADHEKVQPPSMTRVIAVLEQHNLVTRAAHAKDKRQVMLTVTDAGRDLVHQSRQVREAWLAQRLRELTPQELAKLRAAAPILEKLSQS